MLELIIIGTESLLIGSLVLCFGLGVFLEIKEVIDNKS
jgi:hypothetical protein